MMARAEDNRRGLPTTPSDSDDSDDSDDRDGDGTKR